MNDYSIIITASFIKSHPSIEFIKNTIQSLKYTNMKPTTPIILAHDYSDDIKYKHYLDKLKAYISDKPNIKIIVRDTHGHLTGNIRNAFNYINTKYVLIIQHDLPFVNKFSIEKVIEDMEKNTELKHVRFNRRDNIKYGFDALNNLFGKETQSKNYVYTRTPGWSDQNHLCLAEYYKNLVLRQCEDGKPMEKQLHKKTTNEEIHNIYGTYLFGGLNQPKFIKHTDGRKKFSLQKSNNFQT